MLAAARECIREIAAAPAPQLADGTRHTAQQLALRAQPYVARLDALPAHASETWVAVANLDQALSLIGAVTTSPEAWAGSSWLHNASHLLGVADQQTVLAEQVAQQVAESAAHGGTGGRPKKADRDAALVARFEYLRPIRRTLEKRELYEDVAAEHGVAWFTVRDAVLASKKSTKKAIPSG